MAEGFPGRGRDSQPTVLVAGRQRDLSQQVALQLFGERAAPGDGVVIATTRGDPAVLGDQLAEHVPAFDRERIALVNCCGCGDDSSPTTWHVPTPVSFAGIKDAVESARQALDDRGVRRRHFLLDTLTTQFRLAADPDSVLDHAESLAMALGTEAGLAVFAVDPAVVTDPEQERLRHLLDVHVEVRNVDDVELRWTGLVGGSDGWLPLADAGIRYEPLGTSPR